jgi:hypothetical protein
MVNAALAEIGHNMPPEPTPYERVKTTLDNLLLEACNWLDGSGVNTQAEADGVSKLLDDIRKASKAADEARKVEAKPFDDGKAEVQARYKPLLTQADLAADTCKKALAPYLKRLDDEKRAIAEAARKEAEAKQEAARKAMQEADALDFEKRAQAEALVQEAAKAERMATRAENDKAAGRGGARAVTLRSIWRAEMVDSKAAAGFFWGHRRDRLQDLFVELAAEMVRAGAREIPGFNVIEEKVAQ